MKSWMFILVLIGLLSSCKKEAKTYTATPYTLAIPSHFPQMPIPKDNPMTEEGVELGHRLFYDTRLSLDNSISCASCHAPHLAFSDDNVFSKGVNGTLGDRQSMALVNLGWQKFFFWDGRVKTLEDQILQPVPNPVEMHLDWMTASSRIQNDLRYKRLFQKAFGTHHIDSSHVAKAIAQFLRTMISGDSKFDVLYKLANNVPLTAKDQILNQQITMDERGGYDLFMSLNGADCLHCHNGPLMQVQIMSNNGLDAVHTDKGYGKVTGNFIDNGKFKVPSLRNIALSAPYMHDGRFTTLEQVIDHYSHGIQISPTIDPLIEYAFQGGVQLDAYQKMLLKKFLLTLTDNKFITNPKFAEPN